jgi:hypothetical protein
MRAVVMSLLAEAMTSHEVAHTARDVIHASENPEEET